MERFLAYLTALAFVSGAIVWAWETQDFIHLKSQDLQLRLHDHELKAQDTLGAHAEWISRLCWDTRREIIKSQRAQGILTAEAIFSCPELPAIPTIEEP